MPPEVAVTEHAFKGSGRPLREDEERVRFNVASITTRLLTDRGVPARRAVLEASALGDKPEIRFKLTQLQAAFAREVGEATQEGTSRRSKAFAAEHTLGPDVNVFSERERADGLVFVRVEGVRQSEGQAKLGFFLDTLIGITTGVWDEPGSGENAVVQIGLVDGTTGDLLWSDRARTMDFDGMSMEQTLDRLLEGMCPGRQKVEDRKERNQSWK